MVNSQISLDKADRSKTEEKLGFGMAVKFTWAYFTSNMSR